MPVRLRFAPPLLLLAATAGCSTPWMWDSKELCLKDPSGYAALPPERGIVTGSGHRTANPDEQAPIITDVSRKDCGFQVTVRTAKATVTLGPYEILDEGSFVASPARGHYAFIAGLGPDRFVAVVDGVESTPHRSITRPVLSANGEHIAYFASDGERAVVSLDGKTVAEGDAKSAPLQLLGVLDDGRAAFTQKSADGRAELSLGSWTSEPFDELRNNTVWRGARFSAALRHGTRWEMVVNGRGEQLPGEPVTGVMFSNDGAHSALVIYRGDQPTRRHDAIIDGAIVALQPVGGDAAPYVQFWGESVPVAIFTVDARSGEHGALLVGAKAPWPAAPPPDDYTLEHRGKDGWFVQIGETRGPQFDRIEIASVRLDERGHIHYSATRGNETYEVIDHEVQRLGLVSAPAPAPLKVPEADPPK